MKEMTDPVPMMIHYVMEGEIIHSVRFFVERSYLDCLNRADLVAWLLKNIDNVLLMRGIREDWVKENRLRPEQFDQLFLNQVLFVEVQ